MLGRCWRCFLLSSSVHDRVIQDIVYSLSLNVTGLAMVWLPLFALNSASSFARTEGGTDFLLPLTVAA